MSRSQAAGRRRYVYRAVDQYGQVIDVYVSDKSDTVAATRFFTTAIVTHGTPTEITTDRAHPLAKVIEEPLPAAVHDTRQYATTVSKPTTDGSRPGFARCAG